MTAGLTVGGWFASAVVSALINNISSSAIQQFGLQSGLQEHLERLKVSLLNTRFVLRSAEKRRSMDVDLAELMNLLHDAFRDAADLLDDFLYEQLRRRVEGGDQASRFFPSSLAVAAGDYFNNWVDGAVSNITKIQGKLDRLITDNLRDVIKLIDDLDHVDSRPEVVPVRNENSSFLSEPHVLGRDKQRDQLIELLLKSSDGSGSSSSSGSGNSNLTVHSIVGAGGMGKTALAQYVYNDPQIQKHFDLKIWICVSDQFDVKRLVREMLESVTSGSGGHHHLSNLDTLQVALKEKIMGWRFLLVLDDVWNEKRGLWESDLRSVLLFGAHGSKVLVTARLKMVANIMGTEDGINIEGLSEESCWSLFRRCA